MGEIRKVWTAGKAKLTKEQDAKLPKEKFGEMADEFEKTCADAIKKLEEANNALWAVFVDGEDEKGDKSVRKLLEKYAKQIGADKAISKQMGETIIDVDRLKAGFLKKVMAQYAKLKTTAKNLEKYGGN